MTSMFINTPPDMICIGVMSTLRGMPLKMIAYRVNRYEFQVKMLLERFLFILKYFFSHNITVFTMSPYFSATVIRYEKTLNGTVDRD